LEPLGYRVTSISVRDCLHLKSAATALGDDRVLLNPRLIDVTVFDGLSWMEIDPAEPNAANVVSIDAIVLCPASAPRTQERLAQAGFDARAVEASELAKAEGGLTCCSLLLRI
ncbi:MAG TPA: N(G),N(G)-dimethylarginine dimethylaminohydrolase, partial [Gemmatimonadaceae bacterium]|nr:N(G),N(G)-dimethylarginine dimethylaminohydrolase [Gemmatimonadaceae bacterium]